MTLFSLGISWFDLAAILISITGAYIIFGMVGFGTALIASPVLAIFIPVEKIVPILALMDMVAALSNILRDGRKADFAELKRLVPMMAIGSLIGATILLKTRPDTLLLALGIFVIAYSLYSLSGLSIAAKFSSRASIPFGLLGGVFSALFGSGGFVYSIYLSRRIQEKEHFRMTQTTLIGLSTLTRVLLFLFAGVYMDASILIFSLLFAPAMLCGVLIGRHITLRLTREQFIRIINIAIFFSGIGLVGRYLITVVFS